MLKKYCKILLMCFICLEDDVTEIILKCGHSFHAECLKNIIYPYCPLCRSDITYFMTNYKTKKQIKNNIEIEKYRVMVTSIPHYYEELHISQLISIITRIRKLNKIKAYESYFKIIKTIFESNANIYTQLYEKKYKENDEGIYLYYCNTDTFIKNTLYDYKNPIIKWINYSDLHKNKSILTSALGIYKKSQKNINVVPILIVLQENTKYYIEPFLLDKNINTNLIPTTKSIIKFLCEDQPFDLTINSTHTEHEYVKYLLDPPLKKILLVSSFYDFIKDYVPTLFNSQNLTTGIIEVIFQNANCDTKIFEYSYSIKNKNNKIKYYLNSKTISVKKMCYYIQNKMGDEYTLFIRIFSQNLNNIDISTLSSVTFQKEKEKYKVNIISKYEQCDFYNNNQHDLKTNIDEIYDYV